MKIKEIKRCDDPAEVKNPDTFVILDDDRTFRLTVEEFTDPHSTKNILIRLLTGESAHDCVFNRTDLV